MKWQRCEGKGKHGEEEDGGKDDGGNLTMPTAKVCQFVSFFTAKLQVSFT